MEYSLASLVLAVLLYETEGWIGPKLIGDKNFYISVTRALPEHAKVHCAAKNLTLATIKSEYEQKALEDLAYSAKLKENMWIGLELFAQQKAGYYGNWSDGTRFTSTTSYSNWQPNQPEFYRNLFNNDMAYVWLRSAVGWQWDDFISRPARFVCEEKVGRTRYTAEYVNREGERLLQNIAEAESSEKNVKDISRGLNELLNAPPEILGDNSSMSRRLLSNFDNFVNSYQGRGFKKRLSNLQIMIVKEKSRNPITLGYGKDSKNTNMQIHLSGNLLREASSQKANSSSKKFVQVNSILYRTPSLFQVSYELYKARDSDIDEEDFRIRDMEHTMFGNEPNLRLEPTVLGDVISVDISHMNTANLLNPLCITFESNRKDLLTPEIPEMRSTVSPKCVFWDFKTNDWLADGCTTLIAAGSGDECGQTSSARDIALTCQCTHMTYFNVIMDTTYTYTPKYLNYITIAGSVTSLVCLMITAVTILSFRTLRKNTAQQIILHLCVNLFCLHLVFLVGIDRRDEYVMCMVTSVTIHFFLLTTWFWMFVEAVFLFLSLVVIKYRGGVKGKIVYVTCVFAYVLPGVITGLTAGLSQKGNYLSEKYCWLVMPTLMYAFLIPVAIILSLNSLVFLAVMYTLTCGSKMFRSRINFARVRQSARRAICIVFLVGLPWSFGFFMLLARNKTQKEVLAVIFTILNTLQGFAIFFFFCARQEQVRKMWLEVCHRRKGRRVKHSRPVRKKSEKGEVQMNLNQKQDNIEEETAELTLSDNTMQQTDQRKRFPYRHGWY